MNQIPPIDDLDLFIRLAVALASGMLIGLERGWEGRDLPEGSRIAGVRTFGFVGLLGGAVVLFAGDFDGVFLAAVALGIALFAVAAYWRASRIASDIGITTLVVLLLAFVLGALAGAGYLVPASAAAVVVAILLGIKPELHGILQRMDRTELLASLRLLLISVVILPVLPDQGYGPWQALNPYRIWWMVVLIAAISYAGYLSIRVIGTRRGILLTGLLGGLASSTAVTLSFARLAQRGAARPELLAAGVVVSSAVMFPRILVVLAVFAPALVEPLAWALIPAGAMAVAVAAWYGRKIPMPEAQEVEAPRPRNPLDLMTAIKFGLLLAVIMVLVRAAGEWAGDAGIYLLAALSGLGDVDAITLSLASMAERAEIVPSIAVVGVLIAAAVNSAVKPVLAAVVGSFALSVRVALGLTLALAAGAVGFVLRWQMMSLP